MAKSKAQTTPHMLGVSDVATAMMSGHPALAQMWMGVMVESARFMTDRFQEYVDANAAFMKCSTLADIAQFQSTFFLKAMDQYTDEARRMSKIVTDAGDDVAKSGSGLASRAYDDVPV